MTVLAAILIAAGCAGPCAQLKCETQLGELAAAVRSADYRGDREALDRLDGTLAKLPESPLDDYRAYWRGFARWRRAMNGFNEKPFPPDLESDLQAAVDHFQTALDKRKDWIEARLAMVGALGNLMYLAGDDAAKKQKLIERFTRVGKTLSSDGPENPRVLWIVGGLQMAAPPPYGGDFVKAAATMRHGVECSWREANGDARTAAAWIPVWGGPENLMNLAYLYANTAASNKTAALAYAQGALVAVPEWHYVRDILLPQIEAMPEGK
ncbi:MAG TPA: hypothetical protein VIA45_18485 [Thermoanaerobaculia bacterium]|jgi:hypothetical protein